MVSPVAAAVRQMVVEPRRDENGHVRSHADHVTISHAKITTASGFRIRIHRPSVPAGISSLESRRLGGHLLWLLSGWRGSAERS